MKIDIDWNMQFLRGFAPMEYEGDDLFLRLPNDHRVALLRLLGKLSRNDLTDRDLSHDQAAMIDRIYHSLY